MGHTVLPTPPARLPPLRKTPDNAHPHAMTWHDVHLTYQPVTSPPITNNLPHALASFGAQPPSNTVTSNVPNHHPSHPSPTVLSYPNLDPALAHHHLRLMTRHVPRPEILPYRVDERMPLREEGDRYMSRTRPPSQRSQPRKKCNPARHRRQRGTQTRLGAKKERRRRNNEEGGGCGLGVVW